MPTLNSYEYQLRPHQRLRQRAEYHRHRPDHPPASHARYCHRRRTRPGQHVALTWNAFVGFAVKEYRIYRRTDSGDFGAAGAATRHYYFVARHHFRSFTVSNTDANVHGHRSWASVRRFRVVAASTDATELLSNSNEAAVSFAGALNVYNVITPNGDGKNDVLVIDNVTLYPGNTLTIYNRWGREVYKTTNYRNDWGTDPNIAPGNYFYLLTVPNGPSLKTWFEVIK